jgi:hypothetical protein
MNVVIQQLIADAYDLAVHWDNLVEDRDGWKKLAEKRLEIIDEQNGVISKLSNMLYERQIRDVTDGLAEQKG